ncbi:MAG: hypothetical protein AAFX08_10625 [Pseudomonadota bacterium]
MTARKRETSLYMFRERDGEPGLFDIFRKSDLLHKEHKFGDGEGHDNAEQILDLPKDEFEEFLENCLEEEN